MSVAKRGTVLSNTKCAHSRQSVAARTALPIRPLTLKGSIEPRWDRVEFVRST